MTNMGSHVVFVLSQIELDPWYRHMHIVTISCQGIECIDQSGHGMQIRLLQWQNARAAFSQHLPDTLLELFLSLSRFEHLGAEIFSVEDQTVEQESRLHVPTALTACISADA